MFPSATGLAVAFAVTVAFVKQTGKNMDKLQVLWATGQPKLLTETFASTLLAGI